MVFIYLIIFSHFIELFFSKSFSVDSSGLPMYIIIASAINKSLFLFNIYTLNFYLFHTSIPGPKFSNRC